MSLLATLKNLFGMGSKSSSTLAPGDRLLTCDDCTERFVFDAGEQRFFKEKGFTDPKRCPRCRKKIRSRMRKKGRGHSNQSNSNSNNNHQQRGRNHSNGRRHSVIDGDSPYADER